MPYRKKIPLAEYVEAAKEFNPADWDPEVVVKLAVDAGMKCLVSTAKHHQAPRVVRALRFHGFGLRHHLGRLRP